MKTFKKLLVIGGMSIALISCSNKDSEVGSGVVITPQAQELNTLLGKETTSVLTMEDLSKLEADIGYYEKLDMNTDAEVEIAKNNIHEHINKWRNYLLTSNDQSIMSKYNELIMRGMEAKAYSREYINEYIPLMDHKQALHLIIGYEGMDSKIPQFFVKEAFEKAHFVFVGMPFEEGLQDFTNIFQARGYAALVENGFCAAKTHNPITPKCNPAFKALYNLADTLQNEEQTEVFEKLAESSETDIEKYKVALSGK